MELTILELRGIAREISIHWGEDQPLSKPSDDDLFFEVKESEFIISAKMEGKSIRGDTVGVDHRTRRSAL